MGILTKLRKKVKKKLWEIAIYLQKQAKTVTLQYMCSGAWRSGRLKEAPSWAEFEFSVLDKCFRFCIEQWWVGVDGSIKAPVTGWTHSGQLDKSSDSRDNSHSQQFSWFFLESSTLSQKWWCCLLRETGVKLGRWMFFTAWLKLDVFF